MKQARSIFDGPYDCVYPWPENCFVQCGSTGVVIVSGGENYKTAFFEAFPKDPDTFIRGEGLTIKDAEKDAWDQFNKISNCPDHQFERRKYENGAGFCKHCNLFKSKAFDPLTKCFVCEKPTSYSRGKSGKWYCKDHPMPAEDKIKYG